MTLVENKKQTEKTICEWLFVERFAKRIANIAMISTFITPAKLFLISVLFSLGSAFLFLQGSILFCWFGALLFPVSSIVARASSIALQQCQNKNNPIISIVIDTLDPFKTIMVILVLINIEFNGTENIFILILGALFVFVYFLDFTIARIILKVRGAYQKLYQPKLGSVNKVILGLYKKIQALGIQPAIVGNYEKEFMVITIGPILGLLEEMLVLTVITGVLFFFIRLYLDTILVSSDLLNLDD